MARRGLVLLPLALAAVMLSSSVAFLPVQRIPPAAAAAAVAAASAPAMAEEGGGLLDFGKVELGGGFALNLNIPDINLVNISILIAGLFYFLSPVLSESMASREKEIQSDIEDAIAKYNEATSRLAEAEKNKAQADQVVKEINDSIKKDISEFQAKLKEQAKQKMEAQDKSQEKSLKDLESRTEANLESFIDAQAVQRGLKEIKSLTSTQKSKFMDAAIASL
mmetsp:Transcript_144041/g.203808  ORF Transcript_144041/g.203808 Transcript_144041/m.203808 type:complete len:222 (+) Transcript_144041:39-704(+)